MARKPPAAYSGMDLEPAEPPPSLTVETIGAVAAPKRGRPPAAKTLREASAPVMLYLHPAGLKALKRYALDQNTKVHSLLLEAVEAWFKAHGLREPVRVTTTQPASGEGA